MPNLLHHALRRLGHAPAFRGKDRIIRLFANPDSRRPERFEAPFFGKIYPGDLGSFIDWSVWMYGAYSPGELAALGDAANALRRARGSVTALDIGANVGHHSLFLSGVADRVHAFEPFPKVRDEIERKRVRNGANIVIHPVALSDRDETASFHVPATGSNFGMGTLEPRDGWDEITVETRAGDDYLVQAGIGRVDLIKIDVEGHEAAVLKGLRKTLKRDRPVILMEVSGPNRSGFCSLEAFGEALYPRHKAFQHEERRRGYKLRTLDFCNAHEVLVVPDELLGELPTP